MRAMEHVEGQLTVFVGCVQSNGFLSPYKRVCNYQAEKIDKMQLSCL